MNVHVARAGAWTTVQDRGRTGWQRDGVPVAGAMDDVALRIANWLVGNESGAAVLEATLAGPELHVDGDIAIAITGADMDARVDDRRIRPWHAVRLRAGQRLTLDGARRGCRAYIAFAGGLAAPCVLGSRATWTRGRFGGQHGRPLERGDVLATGGGARAPEPPLRGMDVTRLDLERRTVRIVPGPQWPMLTPAARDRFVGEPFTLSRDSDRMGLRFDGVPLALCAPADLLSAPVTMGTVQLPPGGTPIVLMADRQTTGGYPRIGEIAAVDLPVLAQLRPGEAIRFERVDPDAAEALFLARERELASLHRTLVRPA